MFGLSELAVILIVVIAVILAKKGPELARSAGKSARILKAEARAMKKEKEENEAAVDTPPRIIPGETAVPGTGATAPGTERPPAPAPERTERMGGTPPQDSRP
ncbi:twin-arginine translocase TatA/TatE family subunit [Streptomyces violaceus]|uniref:twin-arginine translocase TatA/TatE family subunit n=1 Tax=Streptomyces violaceus TaxID=1936 RepID=UPI002E292D07|nr:twin-arginine translocase TatA/TatE family subunit [Streptomyces violaceus]